MQQEREELGRAGASGDGAWLRWILGSTGIEEQGKAGSFQIICDNAVIKPTHAAEWQSRMTTLKKALAKAREECRPGVWQARLFFNEWNPGSPINFAPVEVPSP